MNYLFYGDNLDVLRHKVDDESVDLVYLDPPFNSARKYNVLFSGEGKGHKEAAAQIEAFDDTWTWGHEAERQCLRLVNGEAPAAVADTIQALRRAIGENDLLAYLIMMAPRLVELHRVLKPTGSLYLHCDPTASHYLKVLLDSIFSPLNFRTEITWLRTTTHGDAKRWSPNADILLYYGKTQDVTWNPVHIPHTEEYVTAKYRHTDPDGRRYRLDNMTSPNPRPNLTFEWRGHPPPANGWRYSRERMRQLDAEGRIWYPDRKDKRPQLKRYLDEMRGAVAGNVWTDISPVNARARERLGYPTQKPVALLERILAASSNPGDVVLDPFCGCGTTVDAAERLGRGWIGMDITYIAVDLITKRLRATHGEAALERVTVDGIPRDAEGARSLFDRDPFDFERWAVSMVHGQPNTKRAGDKGVDGVIRFPLGKRDMGGRALVSVKGGKRPGPTAVRDLIGTVEGQGAEMGVLVTLEEPTKGMREAARRSGAYTWPHANTAYPRVQIVTVRDLLDGRRPDMPPPLMPYIRAQRLAVDADQGTLFADTGS